MTTSEQMELMELKNRVDTLEKKIAELLTATLSMTEEIEDLMVNIDDVVELLEKENKAYDWNTKRIIYEN